MKSLFFLVLITISTLSVAQSLNNYKYVLVPEKFEAFNTPNEYRLNDLTYYLLQKQGFTTFKSKSDLPEDALKNNCLILTTELLKDSGVFTTKVAIQLSNCKGQVVYTSNYGESRDKKYIVAYNLALRNAGKSFDKVNYKFDKSSTLFANSDSVNNSKEANLKAEIEALKKEKAKLLEIKSVVNDDYKVEEKTDENVDSTNKPTIDNANIGAFFAKSIKKDGWQDYNIYDAKGILYFIFYSTGKKDTYLVQESGNDDKLICFKNEGLWYLVSRNETKMESKILKIKF